MANPFPNEQNPNNRPNLPGEKPLDPGQEPGPAPACPIGMHPIIVNDGDARHWQCIPGPDGQQQGQQNQSGGGDGGGGGGPAPGGGGGGGPRPAGPRTFGPGQNTNDFNSLLQGYITDGLNSPSRYTPEVLQSLYGNNAAASSSRIARESAAVNENAAERGISRSGQVDASLRAVRSGAEDARGQANLAVQVQKINADYEDKNAALDRAQKFLDSMRDSEYRYTLLGEQSRQFDANITLGYASLANQRALLDASLQGQFDQLTALFGFNLLTQGLG